MHGDNRFEDVEQNRCTTETVSGRSRSTALGKQICWNHDCVTTPQALEQGGRSRIELLQAATARTRERTPRIMARAQHMLALQTLKLDRLHKHNALRVWE